MQTAIQFFTLRDVDEPLPELLDRVGETSLDGVEFGTVEEIEPVAAALDRNDLSVAGIHGIADEFEDDPESVVEHHRPLDTDAFVIAWMAADAFADRAAVEATATRLDDLAGAFADAGTSLQYHNHDHEFVDLDDGRTGFDAFAEKTETVGIELDVGWAAAAGYDPTALVERYGDQISHLHLKDVEVETGTPVEIGTGDVDMAGCAAAAREAGVEWLIYEHDEPDDPLASLEHGAEFLDELR